MDLASKEMLGFIQGDGSCLFLLKYVNAITEIWEMR